MRLITISAAVLLGSALSAANAQQLQGAAPVPTKFPVTKGQAAPRQQQAPVALGTTTVVAGGSDLCGTATAISGPGLFLGDNIGANFDGPALPCGSAGGPIADVWYDWTATATGSTTIATCPTAGGSAAFDSVIVIYNGTTCVGTTVVCNDDGPGCTATYESTAVFAATAGNVYKIRIAGWAAGETGNYGLNISAPAPPPANDACGTPTVVAGFGMFPFANSAASTGAEGQANAICLFFGSMAITNDLWYSWTAPSTGTITVSTCAPQTTIDTKVAVYDGTGCPGAAAIACNDDACGLQSTLTFSAVAGNAYTIQLGNFPGASGGSGTFSISGPPPASGPCDVLHDGTTENSIGTNNPAHDILWITSQGETGVTTVVKSISTAWGTPLFGGTSAPPDGSPARVGIWSDPNGDRNPTDAVLLQEVATVIAGSNTDALQTVTLSPSVLVTGRYFIGASCAGGTFPAPLDQSSGPGGGFHWVVGGTAGPINYNNLAGAGIPPTNEDTIAPGRWLINGDCKDISIEEICGVVNAGDCPCGNDGAVGNGCANSLAPGGAHLAGSGNAIVSGDTVSVVATDVRGGNPTLALFFSGSEGAPNPVNDGLLCASGSICRLWIWKNPGQQGTAVTLSGPGAETVPDTTGVSISARSATKGCPISNGETRVYTVWYRDPANFGCVSPATSNYTNGLRILWSL
jgi:hypothetical protein